MWEMIQTWLEAIQSNQIIAGLFGTTVLAGLAVYFKSIPVKVASFIFNYLTTKITFDQQDKSSCPSYSSDFPINKSYMYMVEYLKSKKIFSFSKEQDCYNKDDEENNMPNDFSFMGSVDTTYWTIIEGILVSFSFSETQEKMLRRFILNMRFYSIRQKHIENLIQVILEKQRDMEKQGEMIRVFFNRNSSWDSGIKKYQYSQSPYMLTEKQNEIYQKIARFLNYEEKYRQFGKAYHTGFIFHGYPGCGKSQFIKKIAEDFGLPIYILNLACSVNDTVLIDLMQEIKEKHAIVLMEDIDRFSFQGEVKRVSSKKDITYNVDTLQFEEDNTPKFLSFSTILNILDGIYAPDNGLIFIATTNHFDRLDPAFIRAGRFDFHYEFGYMNKKEICNFVRLQLPTDENLSSIRDDISLPISVVSNACFQSNDVKDCINILNNATIQ